MAKAKTKKAPAKKVASKKAKQTEPQAPAARRGAPSKLNSALVTTLCNRIAEGKSLREVCQADDMPSMETVRQWFIKAETAPEQYPEHVQFLAQYTRAREEQADAIFDGMLAIADDGRNDWMERVDEEGEGVGWTFNAEHVQRSKLRIDARKWMLAKMAPKKYGDKVTQEVTGPGGGPVQYSEVPTRDYNDIRRKIAERRAATAHN